MYHQKRGVPHGPNNQDSFTWIVSLLPPDTTSVICTPVPTTSLVRRMPSHIKIGSTALCGTAIFSVLKVLESNNTWSQQIKKIVNLNKEKNSDPEKTN